MTASRLDVALAERGLARSRNHAARLIAEGVVVVDGRPASKPAMRVGECHEIRVTAGDHYVSRGAYKLIAALEAFGVPVEGRHALDAGASTGGFSQVLLERGAASVIALDVGHGQLSPTLLDERLVSIEGENVRSLTRARLVRLSGVERAPQLIVADLSFISLVTVLPALVALVDEGADLVLLVKPQFEVGRAGIREGIVRDDTLRAEAVARVLDTAWGLGAGTRGMIDSPIVGTHGNREFLVHLAAGGGEDPSQWWDRIRSKAGA